MAQCEDCLHYEICEIMNEQYGISKVYPIQCGFYTNTADVAPKSEVELLKADNEQLTINMNAYGLTAKRLAEENESLEIELENMRRNLGDAREGWNDAECEVERLRKALDEYEETSGLKQAKAEVAREIFEEIENYMLDFEDITHTVNRTIGAATFALLKKKYIKGEK